MSEQHIDDDQHHDQHRHAKAEDARKRARLRLSLMKSAIQDRRAEVEHDDRRDADPLRYFWKG